MFIKSIVLDGFKSYGNRVEITGFDPEFNAITGLNGTGKSNILDSICFVLGITNLSNVRAGSLQELIYKHGQAGVTKATVSITFDNRDKRQCPIGYDDHDEITVTRQVVMGGKNKYLINGINVQNKRVSDLFCSVQLNVNNPHFLIMQGRITKVLNMKPPEILSMVEEAAGTRMYEAKKQAAQKTIEKKDAKLKELNDIIIEDITPKLQKLQEERSHYQEFQKVNREVESVGKLHLAYTYTSFLTQAQELCTEAQRLKDDIKAQKEAIEMNKKEAIDLDKKIADLNRKLDEESGSVLKELEHELQSAEKEEASAAAAVAGAADSLQSQLKRDQLLQRALNQDRAALAAKTQEMEKISSMFESLRTASTTAEEQLAAAQQRFLAVSSGKEGDSGSQSLQEQLIAAKQAASEASTRISQSAMEMKHAADRLRTLEKEFSSSSAQYNKDTQTIGDQERELNEIQEQLSRCSYSEAAHRELEARARALGGALRSRRDQLEALTARLQRADFHYSKPTPDFDDSKVFGTVARLIEVADPMYCTALETAAGGKLYNVVVDTETTSKLLLQRGRLQQRTTIIPLNKISSHVIDQNTLKIAQDIGGGPGAVQLALDLVRFERRLQPAMAWVLGGTLVCADMDTARRVTFHPRVRRRAVTLDGDVFDPAGTLTGGARAKGGSQLLQLQDLKRLERETGEMEAELRGVTSELQGLQASADKFQVLQQSYEMKRHSLEVVKARLATTSHAQLHAEIEGLRAQLRALQAAGERDRGTQAATAAAARELEGKVNDIKGHREREFKKAEEELKQAKKAAAQHGGAWQQRAQELDTLRLEVQELQQAVAASVAQLEQATLQAAGLEEARDEAKDDHARTKEAVKELQTRLRRQKSEMANRSSDVGKLAAKKEKLAKHNADIQLKVEEITFKITEREGEVTKAREKVSRLETSEPWIAEEKQHFGAAGGAYDFEARHASTAGQRHQQLTARRDRLQRGLNTRAHALLEKEERQYSDLMRKKRIVEADRAKLVQVMAELDEKKRATLMTACDQVNQDFGSIFKTLLPGAHARLTPPPSLTVLDGLEVKVGFNGVWKDSLGELSGGQRSLVALSLVLAMLLFKPAPLYILDEVDAALDLSHTQNIGIMLKEHFKHSQFIIVSLKDGMFNNANVLFRTRFVDGMSSVQRTVNTAAARR